MKFDFLEKYEKQKTEINALEEKLKDSLEKVRTLSKSVVHVFFIRNRFIRNLELDTPKVKKLLELGGRS